MQRFKYAIICLYNFCINNPLIENPSDFDASFDWEHVTPAVLGTSASIHTVPALPFEPQPSLHP